MTATDFACQPGRRNVQAQTCAILAGRVAARSTWPAREITPIGSVEWTRDYAASVGVTLPEPDPYPEALRPWLHREVRWGRFADAEPHEFVKPVRCKRFVGALRAEVEESVPPDEPCWIAEPVVWAAEWRCYILRGEAVGVGRYDADGAYEHETMPEVVERAVADMLAAHPGPAGWALDVGLLDDGRPALVEASDAWALGLYRGCPRAAYLDVIEARWSELAHLWRDRITAANT